jgi:hypothetical protein
LIGTVLAHWVAGVLRFPKTVVALGLIVAGLSLQYAAGTLGINTDTANMISAELPWRQDFIHYRDSFPIRDRNLVVLIDAPTARRADAFASALAERLRARPERYKAVFLAGDGEFFERNGLLYLSVPELEALGDRLTAAQPLLGLLRTRFNGAGIVEVVRLSVSDADGSDDALARFHEEIAATLEAAARGDARDVAWERLISAAGDDSPRRMILLQPEFDFNRIQPGISDEDHEALVHVGVLHRQGALLVGAVAVASNERHRPRQDRVRRRAEHLLDDGVHKTHAFDTRRRRRGTFA